MKAYFQNKLVSIKDKINSTSKQIIKGVDEYKLNEIVSLSQSLKVLKQQHEELTKDAVKYLSVDDIIGLANHKASSYSPEVVNLLDKYPLESAFKHDRTVTILEREKLVLTFGYSLRDAKV